MLYERCEADARAAGAKRFLCLSSLNGEPFYRALGFNADGAVDIQMGPDVSLPSVVMSRPI